MPLERPLSLSMTTNKGRSMSITWIDLSRYGIHVGFADMQGECKPTIAGDKEAIKNCQQTLEDLGFRQNEEGYWRIEWTQWPTVEQWEAGFEMHKKRPLAEFSEHVVLDESSAIGLIGRNAITREEYEAGLARKEAAEKRAQREQEYREQRQSSTPPSERTVRWIDLSDYGVSATFVGRKTETSAPFVHIQGAEPVKRIYRDTLESLGFDITEVNGTLDIRAVPGADMKLEHIQARMPRVKEMYVPLGDIRLLDVPEAPERFDASEAFDGVAFRERLSKEVTEGRQNRYSLDELRALAGDVAGLDVALVRHEFGMGDRILMEQTETALTDHFRRNMTAEMSIDERIDFGSRLDQLMPREVAKTAQSVSLQQFSTPLSVSAALQSALHLEKADSIWEPTIGNGSLVSLAQSPAMVHGMELDPERQQRTHEQGYANVTQGDAINTPVDAGSMSRVIANPPFGSFPDGMGRRAFETDVPHPEGGAKPFIRLLSQDKYIAVRHLEALSKDGFGGLIIGADNPAQHKPGEYSDETERFLNFVGDNYDIKGVYHVEGRLYNSHGAGWPLLMVVTGGKRDMVDEYNLPDTLPVISNMDDLKAASSLMANEVGVRLAELAEMDGLQQRESHESEAPTNESEKEAPQGQQDQPESDNQGESTPDAPDEAEEEEAPVTEEEEPEESWQPDNKQQEGELWEEEDHETNQKHALEDSEKVVVYKPRSQMNSLNKRVPANLAAPINSALDRVEAVHGDVDAWVADELGWSLGEMKDRLAAEQVDAVALSMFQAESEKGFILGDNTGVGKGRVVATLYAWAIKQGKKPIFCTSKEGLFHDIMRDFEDIGEAHLVKPLILNDTKDIKDPSSGEVLLKKTPKKVVEKAIQSNSIPDEYSCVFMTYSQVNRPLYKSRKANWLINVAEDNVLLFDEVHNASGADSNTGANISSAIRQATFTMGASATYAKRPDNLGVYHFTSMFAGGDPDTVMDAITRGGPEYQEVLSTMLAASGQLVARSHRPAPEPEAHIVNPQYAEGYDSREFSDRLARVIDAMTAVADKSEDIVSDENKEIKDFIKGLPEEAKGAYEGWKAQSLNFGSQAHNVVKVAMYAAKADAIVDEVEADIKEGRRPAIALEGTMETFLREAYHKEFTTRMEAALEEQEASGEAGAPPSIGPIRMNLTYRDTLHKFLDRMILIKRTDRYGNESSEPMVPMMDDFKEAYEEGELGNAIADAQQKEKIDPDQVAMLHYYFAVTELINDLPESLPASPLDYVQSKLRARGIECAEMTGRTLALDYDTDDGIPEFRQRTDEEKDRVAAANGFNNGDVQAIFFNGATAEGVSLNPSLKFKNQEPRTMLFWQVIGDVSAFNQQAGRIDRSGQDENVLPKYKIIVLDTATEKRVVANLTSKNAKLKANTDADRGTDIEGHGVPMMNRVGDLVTFEILNKHPNREDLCRRLKIDLEKELSEFSDVGMKTGTGSDTGLNSKLTGRLCRMQAAEQEPLMDELEEAYKDRVDWLNQQGNNPLQTPIFDLKGTVVNEYEIFPRSGASQFEGDVRAVEVDYIDYIEPIPYDKVEKKMNRAAELLEKTNHTHFPVEDNWSKIEQAIKQRLWENGNHHARGFMETLEADDGQSKTDKLVEAIRKQPSMVTNNEDVINRLEDQVRRLDTFGRLREQLSLGAEIKGFPAANAVHDCEVEAANMVVTRIVPPRDKDDPSLGGKWGIRLTSPDPDVGEFEISLNQLIGHYNNTPGMKITNEPLDQEEIKERFSGDREPRSISCKRFVLVGQLFTAFDITNNADNSIGRGKPGVFTLSGGEKLRGIVMPRSFDASAIGRLMESDFNVSQADVAKDYLAHITATSRHPAMYTQAARQNKRWADANNKQFSAGSGAVILKDKDTGLWQLWVSAVKRTGGNYQADQELRDLLETDLATAKGMPKVMTGTIPERNLDAVIDRLMMAHSQTFFGAGADADWYRDHIRERGQRRIQEQNERDQKLRARQEAKEADGMKVSQASPGEPDGELQFDF